MSPRYGKVEEVNLEEAKIYLDYQPETGNFIWKRNKGKSAKAGSVAGYVHKNGYRRICVCGLIVFAHRLAWLFHYGKPPAYEIDHINGNRADNRIENLRDVEPKINSQNSIRAIKDKNSLIGIFCEDKEGDRWSTQIGFMGKTVRVGGFKTPEEAHQMFIELKKRLHDGFSHHKSEHPQKTTQ